MIDVELVKETYRSFSRHGGRFLSGAIAFYSLLSVVPLLVIALQIVGLCADEKTAYRVLTRELGRWVGSQGAHTLGTLVEHAAGHENTGGPLATVISTAVLVYAATRLFSQMNRAINQLWDIPQPQATGWRAKVKLMAQKRVASFVLVMAVGALLLLLVVTQTGLATMRHALSDRIHMPLVWRFIEAMTSFALTVALFASLMRVLPDARVATRDLLLGAAVTAALFTLGSSLVAAYVGRRAPDSIYGAASSLVMLLLWVHYASMVFFLGVSFTAVHARRRGAGLTITANFSVAR